MGNLLFEQGLDHYHPRLKEVLDTLNQVVIGKQEVVELTLVTLLAGGHVLLEDVPGVGKTMLVRALARSLGFSFKRIQFTPDMLPSDVTGVSIYNPKNLEFEYREGPIFGQLILADEINRTSPKTQAALLEAMEEAHVTVDGVTRELPRPFMVMATQNPIEYEGTFPLPEAQLDRFLMKLRMGYPTLDEEITLITRSQGGNPLEQLVPILSLEEALGFLEEVRLIFIDDSLKRYMVQIIQGTREHPHIYLGVSPRGSLGLLRAAQALAFTRGRQFVLPDDIKLLVPYVLGHRLLLKAEARIHGLTTEKILAEIVEQIPVPLLPETERKVRM